MNGNKDDCSDLHQGFIADKDTIEINHDSTSEITQNLSTLKIASSSCSVAECKSDINKHMLKCSKCKRMTHYRCTLLPAYQLYLFTRETYRLYVCDTCVGDIPDDFKGHCLEETRENEILEIQAMEKRIEQREEYNKMLENDIEVKVQELERCDSRCTKLYRWLHWGWKTLNKNLGAKSKHKKLRGGWQFQVCLESPWFSKKRVAPGKIYQTSSPSINNCDTHVSYENKKKKSKTFEG